MLVVRCNACGKDLTSEKSRTVSCGCPNMTSVHGDTVSGNDMSQVILLQSNKKITKQPLFTPQELEFQEARRRRGVRKLQFEER